jgi:putative ATP-dependent endonuclease of OLD family
MRLRHVTIENCAWCPSLSAEVRGHLVLVGPNESGKSTVLRLIDATLAWTNGRLLSELSLAALRDVNEALVVQLELGDLDGETQAAFPDEIEVSDDGTLRLTIRLEVRRSSDDPAAIEIHRTFVKDGVRPIPLLQRHQPYLRWAHLEASRSAERELGRSRSGTVRALLGGVDLGDDRRAIIDAVESLNASLANATSLESLRVQIAEALSEVFPREVETDEIAIQLPSTNDPLGDVDLRLITDGGESAGLLEQSDGIRSLSVMSLQLLVRNGATITAVDEPEVHLHPRSQARIARLLADKPGQRLVATHSPAVVRAFKPSEVVALAANGARQLPAGAVESDPKFFSHWWIESVLEPLTARGAILVEGVSDETLLRAVERLKGIDLDREGLSVVALGSANNFPNAYKLFGPSGFGMHVASLVDEKEAGIPAEALSVEVEDLRTHGVFIASPDLEALYCVALGRERTLDALISSELFSAKQILTTVGRSGLDDVSIEDLKTFCGHKKRKTLASIAISDSLTEDDVVNLMPLADIINHACAW